MPRRATRLLALTAFACLAPLWACGGNRGGGSTNDLDGFIVVEQNPDLSLPLLLDGSIGPDNATIYVHEAQTLYTMDPATFALTTVGTFGTNADPVDDMTDLAVTPDGQIYTVSRTALFKVDAKTARATKLVDLSSTSNVALTFLPDGTLLAADQAGAVRQITPSSGKVTELGTYGSGFDTAGDLVSVADGTMFGISAKGPGSTTDSNVLIKVSPTTAKATGVGGIGYSGVFGLAFSNGRVLAFTKNGEIVKIDPQTGAGALVKTYQGKSFWGAGTSPLVPIS